MAHQVHYLLAISGHHFNAALENSQAATPAQFDEWNREGSLWECRLPGSDLNVLADLSSTSATLLALPVRYSLLLPPNPDLDTAGVVEECERALKERFPDTPIVRVDEILIEDWSSSRSEDWLRNREQVDQFMLWLRGQSRGHWLQIR